MTENDSLKLFPPKKCKIPLPLEKEANEIVTWMKWSPMQSKWPHCIGLAAAGNKEGRGLFLNHFCIFCFSNPFKFLSGVILPSPEIITFTICILYTDIQYFNELLLSFNIIWLQSACSTPTSCHCFFIYLKLVLTAYDIRLIKEI